jgi:hypothetical protein
MKTKNGRLYAKKSPMAEKAMTTLDDARWKITQTH